MALVAGTLGDSARYVALTVASSCCGEALFQIMTLASPSMLPAKISG